MLPTYTLKTKEYQRYYFNSQRSCNENIRECGRKTFAKILLQDEAVKQCKL